MCQLLLIMTRGPLVSPHVQPLTSLSVPTLVETVRDDKATIECYIYTLIHSASLLTPRQKCNHHIAVMYIKRTETSKQHRKACLVSNFANKAKRYLRNKVNHNIHRSLIICVVSIRGSPVLLLPLLRTSSDILPGSIEPASSACKETFFFFLF